MGTDHYYEVENKVTVSDALKIIKKIEPKIIIPTHYDLVGLKFPVPQQTLEDALKGLATEPKEPIAMR